jgi:MtN3 and saliva related transmembrane protein
MNVEYVGYVAAILTSVSFFVQAMKSFKTHDLSGISLGMYTLFTLGIAFWLTYGVLIENWTLIVTNIFTLSFAASVLVLKIRQVLQTRASTRFVEPVARQPEHETR